MSVDLKNCRVEWHNVGFGAMLYILFIRAVPTPVGFVWGLAMAAGNARKTRFEVFGSYVVPFARRSGVRTKLNAQLLEHWQVITTQNGSKEGGLRFMRAQGYRLDKRSGVWSLTRKPR